MPALRQPVSLESMATHCLVKFFMQFLNRLDNGGSLEDFRQGVSVIKDNMRDRMPSLIRSDFLRKFLQQVVCTPEDRWRDPNHKAALELLMDGEVVDQSGNYLFLSDFDPEDMHRFRGITELDFPFFPDRSLAKRFLENCHLNNVTRINLEKRCFDDHLTHIGKNCPKLEDVRLQKSPITDEGLRALTACENLRVVDITDCRRITHVGVNHLISVHKKIRQLSIGNWNDSDAYDDAEIYYEGGSVPCVFLSRLENPCLSLEWLCMKTPVVKQTHLGSIIKIFPNLSRLTMICEEVQDLTILQSLSNLTEIRIGFSGESRAANFDSAWHRLQDLLKLIGSSITTLEFSPRDEYYLEDRQGLNFIYEYCPNIECLKFDFAARDLIVPPFPKLETFSLRSIIHYAENQWNRIALQPEHFVTLENVERLELKNFSLDPVTVQSMMLNNTMFPKLKYLVTNHVTGRVREINRFARENNLDFELTMYTFRTCVSRREN